MDIRIYSNSDTDNLFDMLKNEGAEWEDYWGINGIERYKTALANSFTCVAYDGNMLCGYIRCRDDDGFGVYVCDLLVDRSKRGNSLGRLLIEKVCASFPDSAIYIMSDVDKYYEKQGYHRIGSIFEAKLSNQIRKPREILHR